VRSMVVIVSSEQSRSGAVTWYPAFSDGDAILGIHINKLYNINII